MGEESLIDIGLRVREKDKIVKIVKNFFEVFGRLDCWELSKFIKK